jgi:hypothetical protein
VYILEKREIKKKIKNILLLALVFVLPFCNPTNTSLIESLTPPVILIIKTDSVVMVGGANGEKYRVNTTDKVDYRIAFLTVGDTLKLNE